MYTLYPNKNVTTLSRHNSDIQEMILIGWWLEFNVPFQHKYGYIRDELILIIFGTNGTEKLGSQRALYFSTSPNYCCNTWGNRKSGNCVFSLKCWCCMLFTKNIKHIKKYHLVTAKPPFTVKAINCVCSPATIYKGSIASYIMLPSCLMFTKSVTVLVAV